MSRLLRSLAGLVLLVGIVAGVPYGLWKYGRSLLPGKVPTLAEFKDALFTRDSGQTFISLLVIIAAVAWLLFVICVILEIVARLAGRERARRIRGLRPAQAGAAALIGLIVPVVMLGGASVASAQQPRIVQPPEAAAAGSAHPTATGVGTAPQPAPVRAADRRPAAVPRVHAVAAPTAHRVWVVERYDSLWKIAEQCLGDGRLYPQIVQLNAGVQQLDGKTLHDAATPLEIGWRLILPAAAVLPTDRSGPPPAPVAAHQVTVAPGQTLSEIAESELGTGDAYPAIADANHLTNPDDLAVGQVLTIPGTSPAEHHQPAAKHGAADIGDPAITRTAAQHADAEKAAAARAAAEKAATAGRAAETAAADKRSADKAAAERAAAERAAAKNAAQTTDMTPAPTTAAAPSPPPAGDHPAAAKASTSPAEWVELGGGAGALAGAVWLGLLAARRRQRRRRPAKKVKAPTSVPAARMERTLRDRAGAADIIWMDKALRYAASLTAAQPDVELPDLTCIWLSAEELQMQLAAPTPAPAPFTAEDDSWILSADTDIPATGWTESAAPFPALASIGEMDGESLLLDLERLGALTLTGDQERTAALMRHLAVEFAHNLWSDYLPVTLVGWGEHLTVLNPDRLRHAATVGQIITALHGRIAETIDAEQELDSSLLRGRIRDQVQAGGWSPEVYLIEAGAGTEQDLAALSKLLSSRPGTRTAVAVVARDAGLTPAGGAVIHIGTDGTLTLPEVLGSMQLVAAGLSEHELDLTVELFRSAGQFSEPGPLQSDESWAAHMDATGALTVTDHAPVDSPADEPGIAVDDDLDAVDDVGQKVLPLRKPASAAAQAALEATLAGDPELDADLAEWNEQLITDPVAAREATRWVKRPRIGVLGAPLVLSNGVTPADQHNRYTEFAVYFAVHREASPAKVSADLWPTDNQPGPALRNSYVSRTRSWLGLDEQGRKHLSEARAGRGYRLSRLLDIELLRRLRKRADARLGVGDTAGARTDLVAALQLVRGPLLDGASADTYSWLVTSDPAQLELASSTVVKAAHQLVRLALDTDDFDTARTAGDTAHRFDPDDDLPKIDHVMIAQAAGDSAAKRAWAKQILRDHHAELIEDVENYDTMLALSQVFPQGLRLAEAG